MSAAGRVTVHYVPTGAVREYVVEVRQGRARWSVGRVMGCGGQWTALGVGAGAWTAWVPTRAAAVAAMTAGVTFLAATA